MQAPTTIQQLYSTGLDTIVETLQELQLHMLEARVPESDRLLDLDYGRLEPQLNAYLGPRPSWEDLRCLTFSFANVIT